MQVLFVCGGNSGVPSTFITEQAESIRSLGIAVDFFMIKGHGIIGYLRNLSALGEKIRSKHYDLIHAHYGLTGMLCVLLKKLPVVTTFHGSDIYWSRHRYFSKIAHSLSSACIFVSTAMTKMVPEKIKDSFIPCGVDLNIFAPQDFYESRKKLGISKNEKIVLFCSSFDRWEKNSELAFDAINNLPGPKPRMVELNGMDRESVALWMNASNLLLMTSMWEGSPQVVKEALSCGLPVVTVDVGDVKKQIGQTAGCHIVDKNPGDIAGAVNTVLGHHGLRVDWTSKGWSLDDIASKIVNVYKNVLGNAEKEEVHKNETHYGDFSETLPIAA